MIDSHCHLFYEGIIEDLDQKLEHAKSMGVEYFLTVSTNSNNIQRNIDIANSYENIYCSIGIHPLSFHNGYNLDKMKKLIKENKKIVAIGEVGLEYHYQGVEKKDQLKLFDDMLSLAKETKLPLILHLRECFDDELFNLLDVYRIPAVFHCYTDSFENAKRALKLGYLISFSGIITFKNCGELKEIAKYVPDDMFLIETDAPFLTPVPFRGKKNEPAYVKFVCECIANIRNVNDGYISTITDENFFSFFNIESKISKVK